MTFPCPSETNCPSFMMRGAHDFADHNDASPPAIASQEREKAADQIFSCTSMLTSHSNTFHTDHSTVNGSQIRHLNINVETGDNLTCAPAMASLTLPISSSVDDSVLKNRRKRTPTTKYGPAFSRIANDGSFPGDGIDCRLPPSANFKTTVAPSNSLDENPLPMTPGSSLCHNTTPSHSALKAIAAADAASSRKIPVHDLMLKFSATSKIITDEKNETPNYKRHRASVVGPIFTLPPLSPDLSASVAVFPVIESPAKRVCLESNYNQFSGKQYKQDATMASNVSPQDIINTPTANSNDKDWFEGVLPLSLPDDPEYFSEFHCLIRANLELFSASAAEVGDSNAGRRIPVVKKKVGIRCIHCARAVTDSTLPNNTPTNNADNHSSIEMHINEGCNTASYVKRNKSTFSGSVSYPINIAGLYPLCSQKPALHFEKCRNLPIEVKQHFYRLTHDKYGLPQRQRHSVGTASGGVITNKTSPVKCYFIAAKRIGLVDVFGGIRFGRDLALAPLLVEDVLARYYQYHPLPMDKRGTEITLTQSPTPLLSCSLFEPVDHAPLQAVSQDAELPTITADEESERVLGEAIADCNDRSLVKNEDKLLVTDFVFLCTAQMAVCHATQADFLTRGKKTKIMRLGLAGFCCRHCSSMDWTANSTHAVDTSCRSFASAPDNLASAISNSFHAHLHRCFMVPPKVKLALTAFKKLHVRQMSRLAHGSQRRFFHFIWSRLRQADISEAEMREKQDALTEQLKRDAAEWKSLVSEEEDNESRAGSGFCLPVVSSADTATAKEVQEKETPFEHSLHLPRCEDVLVRCVLDEAAKTKPKENDGLIVDSDRSLISDFVFLVMKQTKTAHPTLADFSRGKRSHTFKVGMTGLCCKHCTSGDQMWPLSGRSFPSAPDNLASSINTSMFQHLLKCERAPLALKDSLQKLKKLHSGQTSLLPFGSQRRFFELVFARLRAADLSSDWSSLQEGADAGFEAKHDRELDFDFANNTDLKRHGFTKNLYGWFLCTRCRMVPLDLRAEGSLTESRPTVNFLKAHSAICKGSTFELGQLISLVEDTAENNDAFVPDVIVTAGFKKVVHALVGGNMALVQIFTHGLLSRLYGRDEEGTSDDECSRFTREGLWNKFPTFVDNKEVQDALDEFVASIDGLSPAFVRDENLVKFMQIVSPSYLDCNNFDEGGRYQRQTTIL